MKRSMLNWKTYALVIVGLVVVGPLIRQVVSIGRPLQSGIQIATPAPQTGQATPLPAQTPQAPAAPARGRSKTTTVSMDGRTVPAVSQPTILLNPGLVRPGTKVAISGFGFDPGSIVNVMVKNSSADAGTTVTLAKVDGSGSFIGTFTVPEGLVSRSPTVLAQELNSNKTARTQAMVPASMATVKLGKDVGKPGDILSMSAKGFAPDEEIKVYWGQLYGDPAATLHADGGGNVGQASLRIPVGAVGTSNLVLVGTKSQSIAIAQFLMLSLYPSVKIQPYAVKAANRVDVSGKGFGPGERILVYVNAMDGPPLMIVQADANGSFAGAGFVVPFGLKKQQSLILVGESSRAVVNSGFLVLPYTPSVQPSTYGGFPGTTLSFYASGFAPNEVVLVYKNRAANGGGQLVSAFRVDSRGRAAAAGQYTIPSEDQGKVTFTMVGRTSDGTATAAVQVQHSDVPVQVPPQPKYTLPPDLQDSANSPATGAGAKAAPAGVPAGEPAAAGGQGAAANPGQTAPATPDQAAPAGADQAAPATPGAPGAPGAGGQ